MHLLKKNLRSIRIAFFVILTIVLLILCAHNTALLIQYPPARDDLVLILGYGPSIALLIFSFWMVMWLNKTKLGKDTCFFVVLVIAFSLSGFILANIVFRAGFPIQWTIAISVFISTPLACKMAGYSKKTLRNRLRKLGLNQGITLATIIILALMPIIQFSPSIYTLYFPQQAMVVDVASNVIFQHAVNTSDVNCQINSSGFFAEVPIYENRTFEAEKILELANLGSKSVDLHFYVTGFMGNFEFLKHLEFYLVSSSERVSIVNMDSGVVYCNQTTVSLKPNSTLSLGIICTGAKTLTFSETLGLFLSVQGLGDDPLQKINIFLKTVE